MGIDTTGQMRSLAMPRNDGYGVSRRAYQTLFSDPLARDEAGDVITCASQADAIRLLESTGCRLPTAAEDQEIIENIRPSHSVHILLRDMLHYRQWTSTGLFVPDGEDPEEYREIDGRKYWPRIVTENGEPVLAEDRIVCKVLIPESGIVEEISPFGFPAK